MNLRRKSSKKKMFLDIFNFFYILLLLFSIGENYVLGGQSIQAMDE